MTGVAVVGSYIDANVIGVRPCSNPSYPDSGGPPTSETTAIATVSDTDGKRYADLSYADCQVAAEATRLIEDGTPPRDAAQVGTTWKYVNKSGGPDRRYKDNRQLPIIQYGELALLGPSRFHVLWRTSKPEAASSFAAILSNDDVAGWGGLRGSRYVSGSPRTVRFAASNSIIRNPPTTRKNEKCIAEFLAEDGATVLLADIQYEKASEVAESMSIWSGRGSIARKGLGGITTPG